MSLAAVIPTVGGGCSRWVFLGPTGSRIERRDFLGGLGDGSSVSEPMELEGWDGAGGTMDGNRCVGFDSTVEEEVS